MEGRPEPTTAPNGVELLAHRGVGGVVRGEASATFRIDEPETAEEPTEVVLEQGAIWVAATGAGSGIHVTSGGVEVVVNDGAAVIEAGFSGEGLVLVASGELVLVSADRDARVLGAGQVGVLGPDGTIDAIDEVGEDELATDPWVVANQGLDDAERAEVAAAPPEPEPEPEAGGAEAEAEGAPVEEPAAKPDPAAVVATVLAGLAGTGAAAPADAAEAADVAPPADETAEPGEPADHEHHDLPYATDVAAGEGGADGRKVVRALEVVLLAVVILVAVAVIAVFNRKDRQPTGPASIDSAVSVDQPTSTEPRPSTTGASTTEPRTTTTASGRTTTTGHATTTTRPAATTTASSAPTTVAAVTPVALIKTCSVKSPSTIVASGALSGARAPSRAYRIRVSVRKTGNVVLGSATKDLPVPANGSTVLWTLEVPIHGDYTGAGCTISASVI